MPDIHRQLDLNPDAIFLESSDGKLSYGEVDGLVRARARELGDRNGGQVVVRPRIDVESVVEFLAVARAGGTAVAVSPNLPEELAAERDRSREYRNPPQRIDPVHQRNGWATQRGSADRIELGSGGAGFHRPPWPRGR